MLPVVLVLVILGVAGYFGWRSFEGHREAKRRERAAIEAENARIRAENERLRRVDDEPEADAERGAEAVESSTLELPPEPPGKPEAEILREVEECRKAVWAQVEEARRGSDAKPRESFAGVKFGEPMASARPVRWGTALGASAGDSVSARGVAFAVYGPKSAVPIYSLDPVPLVWVTPKERRPYRIEFSRALAPKGGARHDPETTNIVASLRRNLRCEPFVTVSNVPGRAGCEYVFPMGVTTWTVGEYDGTLRFAVERVDIRDGARAETDALRQILGDVSADGALLDSARYPNGGVDLKKYRGLRFKDGTPSSFCGVVFGSAPAENTAIQLPQKGAPGFFLDYRMAKCPPFRGFVYGRADIDPVRGGVYAVRLSSEGGVYGQDDRDYYEAVKNALSRHYKVTPAERNGEGGFPELAYVVGDLVVRFGPDPRGGFYLQAVNSALASLASAPQPAAGPRKR